MDFQARRKLTKKSIGPIHLVLLILALFNLPQHVIERLRNPEAVVSLVEPFLWAGVFAALVFLVYAWRLHRQQLRLQRRLQDLDLVQLSRDGKVGLFLYLRSFRMGPPAGFQRDESLDDE